jgi:hypothetical protein
MEPISNMRVLALIDWISQKPEVLEVKKEKADAEFLNELQKEYKTRGERTTGAFKENGDLWELVKKWHEERNLKKLNNQEEWEGEKKNGN